MQLLLFLDCYQLVFACGQHIPVLKFECYPHMAFSVKWLQMSCYHYLLYNEYIMTKKTKMKYNDQKRQGKCDKPLVSITNFCMLHWRLQSLTFFLHILYRLVSGVCEWGRMVTDGEEQYISKSKDDSAKTHS